MLDIVLLLGPMSGKCAKLTTISPNCHLIFTLDCQNTGIICFWATFFFWCAFRTSASLCSKYRYMLTFAHHEKPQLLQQDTKMCFYCIGVLQCHSLPLSKAGCRQAESSRSGRNQTNFSPCVQLPIKQKTVSQPASVEQAYWKISIPTSLADQCVLVGGIAPVRRQAQQGKWPH